MYMDLPAGYVHPQERRSISSVRPVSQDEPTLSPKGVPQLRKHSRLDEKRTLKWMYVQLRYEQMSIYSQQRPQISRWRSRLVRHQKLMRAQRPNKPESFP